MQNQNIQGGYPYHGGYYPRPRSCCYAQTEEETTECDAPEMGEEPMVDMETGVEMDSRTAGFIKDKMDEASM